MTSPAQLPPAGRPRRRIPPTARVWLLTGALGAAAVALWWTVLRGVPAPATELELPWWVLVFAFALSERCVVHVHVRRSAATMTLGEIPLAIGLVLSSPEAVVLGWLLGGALALGRPSGIPLIRLAFNFAQFALVAAIAAAVFRAVAGDDPTSDPGTWAAAALGVLVSAVAGVLLVAAAMRLSGEELPVAKVREMLLTAALVSATNASLGLAAAAVLAAQPAAGPLLLAPIATIFLAYRAYTSERQKHTSLEFLYDASRTLARASDAASGIAGMLAMALETFRAERAEAWMLGSGPDGPATRVAVAADGHVETADVIDPAVLGTIRDLIARDEQARIASAASSDGPVAALLAEAGVGEAMVASLPGEHGSLGAVLIGDRAGVGGTFEADELRLFETLAAHAGAALSQDRLGRKITQLNDIQRHLEHQAFHDALTGLANRLLFHDRVAHALSRRTGNAAALYIDLDEFKPINDTLGHDAGDAILVATGERLQRSLRPSDTAARLGGDEFAVLLVDIPPEHISTVAHRILDALVEPVVWGEHEIQVHASIGVALAASGEMDADGLLRDADVAMYACKHSGKRGVSMHESVLAAGGAPAAI